MGTGEIINEWLIKMYDREITEAEGAISNERIWRFGARTPEEYDVHTANITRLLKYVETLKTLKNNILKEDQNNA